MKFIVFWDVASLKLTDISEVRTASFTRAMVMEAVRISETSVNFNLTARCYIPEDSKLQWWSLAENKMWDLNCDGGLIDMADKHKGLNICLIMYTY
jgi:hypothetical protein